MKSRWQAPYALAGLVVFVAASFTVSNCAVGADPERFALLVGINHYADPIPPLAGAENDASAFRDVLVNRWSFPPTHIRSLRGVDAARLGVLNAVTGILSDSNPGDEVLIFFAGHGTSAADRHLSLPLPHTTGALLPSDVHLGSPSMFDELIIGRRDLRPLLEALDRGGRRVFVLFDSCYSGNTVRGQFADDLGRPRLPGRSVDVPASAMVASDAAEDTALAAEGAYPYKNVVYFAAASEHEVAGDIPADFLKYYPTRDNLPHGAFSDAVLRGLSGELPGADGNRDHRLSYLELFGAVRQFMAARGYAQSPQLLPIPDADSNSLLNSAVFGATSAATPALASKLGSATQAKRKQVAIRFVGFEADERRELSTTAAVTASESSPDYVLLKRDEEALLLTAAGDQIARTGAGIDLVGLLRHAAQRHELDRLIAAKAGDGTINLSSADPGLGATRVDGELLSLRLSLAESGYIVVLDLDSGGNLRVLYPYFDSENVRMPAQRVLALGGSRVVAPFGIDLVAAFALAEKPTWIRRFVGKDIGPGDPERKDLFEALTAGKSIDAAGISILTVGK